MAAGVCHGGSRSTTTSQGQSGGTEKTERRGPFRKRNVHPTPLPPLPSTHFLPPARLDLPKVSHFPNNAIGRGPSVQARESVESISRPKSSHGHGGGDEATSEVMADPTPAGPDQKWLLPWRKRSSVDTAQGK